MMMMKMNGFRSSLSSFLLLFIFFIAEFGVQDSGAFECPDGLIRTGHRIVPDRKKSCSDACAIYKCSGASLRYLTAGCVSDFYAACEKDDAVEDVEFIKKKKPNGMYFERSQYDDTGDVEVLKTFFISGCADAKNVYACMINLYKNRYGYGKSYTSECRGERVNWEVDLIGFICGKEVDYRPACT